LEGVGVTEVNGGCVPFYFFPLVEADLDSGYFDDFVIFVVVVIVVVIIISGLAYLEFVGF